MGLLDSVLGALQGSNNQAAAPGGGELGTALSGLLAASGGVGGLMSKFQQGGLGEVASSWVSSGQNLPVSPDQLKQVLGSDTVANLAKQMGVDPNLAASTLSTLLPSIIDKMTPNGQVPAGTDHGGLLSSVLSQLGSH